MPELTLPDATLHFEVEGNGPPLLMIAGFMSDSASWAPLRPLLRDRFTLIRPDMRTTGRTIPWDTAVSIETWARDGLALLDHLGHPRAHVLGHSLGGNIGWVMAKLAPDRVASCMMLGSALIMPRRNVDVFRGLIAIRRSNAAPDVWFRMLFPWLFSASFLEDAGAVDRAIAQSLAYAHTQSADAMERQLETILAITPDFFMSVPEIPVSVLLGSEDLLIPPGPALQSLDGIPCRIQEGGGHSLHWEAPRPCAEWIADFAGSHPV
ncbi:alpha/beta fold hydrolase [Sulfitobacter sp. LCG007]